MRNQTLTALAATALLLLSQPAFCAAPLGGVATSIGQSLINYGSPNTAGSAAPLAPPPSVVPPKPCQSQADQAAAAAAVAGAAASMVPPVPSQMQTCLDKYKNFSMGGSLGYPDLSGLISQAMNQVCGAVDMKLQPTMGAVNQGLPRPGGVGRINTNSTFGGGTATGGNVSVGSGGVTTGNSSGFLQSGGAGYSVPQLWH